MNILQFSTGKYFKILQNCFLRWLVTLSLNIKKDLRSLCLGLVIFEIEAPEKHKGKMEAL